MIDQALCAHETTEPAYAYLHPNPVKVGDPVFWANEGRPVARICLDCHAQLHAGWGCTDCDWQAEEQRGLCDVFPSVHHVLARPCKEHQ